VVLQLTAASPHRFAVEAALRVARAYHASLESVFVEDQRLLDLTAHEGVAELSICGRDRRSLSAATFLRQFAYAAREAERRIGVMARLAEIPYAARTVRDTPTHALGRACAEQGPWNVVALADPFAARDRDALLDMMAAVDGVTGYVLVSPAVRRITGPVVVVVEDVALAGQLVRTAGRLAAETNDPIQVLALTPAGQDAAAFEHAVRLMLADGPEVAIRVLDRTFDDTGALAEVLRRARGGFVVGAAGRTLLAPDTSWQALTQALECPLFVVR
jgi:hypothetical protein